MATEVSSIFVRIGARTAKFEKGMQRVQRRLRDFGRAARSIAGGLAVAGLAGGAAFVLIAKRAFSAIDAVGKFSTRTGVAVSQFNGFKTAVEAADVSIEQAETALGRMRQTIGDAADGSKESVKALEKLGLTADQLIGKETLEQFGILIDRLRDVDTAAQRTAIGRDVFGRSFDKLTTLVEGGSEAIGRQQKVFKSLGLNLDDKLTKSVERAGDRIDRIRKSFSIFSKQVVSELAPRLNVLLDVLETMGIQFLVASGGADKLAASLADTLVKGAAAALAKVQELVAQVRVAVAVIADLARPADIAGQAGSGIAAIGRGEIGTGLGQLGRAAFRATPLGLVSDVATGNTETNRALEELKRTREESERQTRILEQALTQPAVAQ